jgi:hypothetical protein
MAQAVRSSPATIRRLADRLEPRLRRQFLAAVAKLQQRISLAAIARAVELGGMTTELSQALTAFPRDLQPAVRTLNDAFAEVATRTAKGLPAPVRLRTSFTLTNPFAVVAADTGTAHMVREVTQKTRRAIQEAIARSIREHIPPRGAAVVIRDVIGLTEKQQALVFNARQRLINAAPGSLVKLGKVKVRIPSSPMTRDAVDRRIARFSRRLLNVRAEAIAVTQTHRAQVDGQLALWRAARNQGVIDSRARKRWIVTVTKKWPCDVCRPLHGVSVPLDEAFPGGLFAPPAHARCKCGLALTTGTRQQQRAA